MKKDELKVTVIISICIFIASMLMTIVFKAPKKDYAHVHKETKKNLEKNKKTVAFKPQNKPLLPQNKHIEPHKSTTTISFSGYNEDSSNYNKLGEFSQSQQAKIEKYKAEAEERQNEYIQEQLEKILNDSNTPPKVRLRVLLQTSESYVKAYIADEEQDYATAIENYKLLYNDKNSTTEMKYVALEGLQKDAQATGDLELFIYANLQMGEMIANEDLSVFKLEKDTAYLKWAKNFENLMRARKDRNLKSKLIAQLAEETCRSNEEAERVLNIRIQSYENTYKEFVN